MDKLHRLDIQLLIAFDALMIDPHVTRAARTIGVSQPAMSHILARLRELFDDPLLARTTHGMAPTKRALELIEPVHNALRQIRKVLNTHTAFNPAQSRDSFKIRMGDVNESLILPRILNALEKEAPHISLRVTHMPTAETLKALDSDEIDFAISTGISHPKSVRATELLNDEMICLMRKGHPAARQPLTLKALLSLRHIKIAQSIFDESLAKQQLTREIVLDIPQWLAAPFIVESTDFVAVVSRRMANLFNVRGQFELRPILAGRPTFKWCMYWHRRYDQHPAQKWMRTLIVRVCDKIRNAE